MLILQENEVYCVDRDNSIFQVDSLKFPHRKDPRRHLTNTLLDGVSQLKSFDRVVNEVATHFPIFRPMEVVSLVVVTE